MQVRIGGLLSSVILWTFLFASNANAVPNSSSQLSAKNAELLEVAQQKINTKNYLQALELSEQVLAEIPSQFAAQFIRAYSLSQLGKIEAAIDAYESILKSNSTQPEVYNNLATLYARRGDLDLARETLDKGLATNMQYKTLYDNLSAVYVEIARGAYSKALKLGVQTKVVQLKTLSVTTRLAQLKIKSQENLLANTNIALARVEASVKKQEKSDVVEAPAPIKAVVKSRVLENPILDLKPTITSEPVVTIPTASVKKELLKNQLVNVSPIERINKDEVVTALQGWAAAWSAQAVDLYLSFYGKDFKPVKLSKKVWAVQRRLRIRKPKWVNVRLNDFEFKSQQKDKAVIQLVQDYHADNYRDKTKKQFIMRRTADGWRIISEKSLAVIR